MYTPTFKESGKAPFYKTLYEAIKEDIAAGRLRPRDRLPSIRTMARLLGVSTTPVETAYQQLIAEGYIESRPRRGYDVVPLPDTYGRLTLAGESGFRSGDASASDENVPFDFHMAKNDFSLFPWATWRKLVGQTIREDGPGLMFYGDPQGEPGLRTELAGYLHRFRGVVCRPDQIVIGAEQHLLMHILASIMPGLPRVVATENPCYPLIPLAFEMQGYRRVYVTDADQGLSFSRLRDSGARIAVVAPSHQFPGGRAMPYAERAALLEWAKASRSFIIEDDYGGELRYEGLPVPALQGLDAGADVVYVGGFSQIFAPDVCIHYMVLPDALLERYERLKRRLLFEASASRVYQRAMQRLMAQGHFERHIRRMRNGYRKRQRALVASLRNRFGGAAEIVQADAGLHVMLKLRADAPEKDMVEALSRHGIRVASASPFYEDETVPSPERRFIVGFGGIALERIDEGVRLMRQVWEPYLSENSTQVVPVPDRRL